MMAASPGQAAERQQISIAPGRLGEAAIALGRQTGASIGMSDQSLAGMATPAVEGRMTVEAALKRLVKGSGPSKIGRAHVCTPVTNSHLVCRLLLENTARPIIILALSSIPIGIIHVVTPF